MQTSKKWWQSRTIWGVIISGLCKTYLVLRVLFKFSGVDLPMLPAEFEKVMVDAIVTITSFIGDILAIIGRVKAKTTIE